MRGKALFASLALALLAACGPADESAMDLHRAWVASQYLVESRLRSPATARFQEAAVARGAVRRNADGTVTVDSYVDSQNAFGAVVRTNFRVTLRKDSGAWVAASDPVWK